MAFSVALHLDRRAQNKDGSYKIILQIIVNRKNTSIVTDYSVPESDWDTKNRRIRNSSKVAGNIARINNILGKQRTDAMDKLTALSDGGLINTLPITEIRSRIASKSDTVTVFEMFDKIIGELKAIGNIGNANAYFNAKRSITNFTKEKDLPFSHLTFAWLKKYEQYYFSKDGNSINGFSTYLRSIRAVYNRAIKEGAAKKDDYPFQHYKIVTEKTAKRALKEEHIEAIRNFDPGKGKRLALSKDMFLISFHLVGISFADLASLKMSDMHDGRITYKRKKTKQLINLKITPKLQEILNKYIKGKKPDNYIFSIIKRDTPDLINKDIRWAMKRHNKALKVIAEKCEITENITSYWSRHSWATIAKRKGVSTAVISESMGHTTEKITQVYLDSFEAETIDAANELVTG